MASQKPNSPGLTFEVFESEDDRGRTVMAGRFSHDWDSEDDLDDLQAELDAGRISQEEAARRGRKLLAAAPGHLEIMNFVASRLRELTLIEDAAKMWASAYKLGVAVMPPRFKGEISWYHMDNRLFLRVCYGYMLSLVDIGRADEARAVAKRLLQWNPSDSQGVRLVLGDIELICGHTQAAMKLFLAHAPDYPTLWYRAGLVAFFERDYVKACTYIRRGLAGNIYVAEAITGRTLISEHAYWHGSNIYGAEWALDYVNSPVFLLWDDDAAADFVDWVLNCSAVLRERADLMEAREGLTYVHAFQERGPLVERVRVLTEGIDDRLSDLLVRQVSNRWGRKVWPWDRRAMARPIKDDGPFSAD